MRESEMVGPVDEADSISDVGPQKLERKRPSQDLSEKTNLVTCSETPLLISSAALGSRNETHIHKNGALTAGNQTMEKRKMDQYGICSKAINSNPHT